MRLIISGANGFVGSALIDRFTADGGDEIFGIVRQPSENDRSRSYSIIRGNLGPEEDWAFLPKNSDALIHAAARVHVMRDHASDPLSDYRKVNVEGTLNLARRAAAAGLRRFVFISTLKVNGESTPEDQFFTADETPKPRDPYSVSKWEAETGLKEISLSTGMELVIVRPPLVYGPGVKGNFRSMSRWLMRGIPTPLSAVQNRRSMVYLGNLVDLLVTCVHHPAAVNQTFLVSDGNDLSTAQLLRLMGAALGSPARVIRVPEWLLASFAAAFGKSDAARRLSESLRADISKTRRVLGWKPTTTVEDGLVKTAAALLYEARF